MATPAVMPQMGESIAEGSIVRWFKKVGDPVDRDEQLLEISTDKVDAEIPSPAAGVLTAIQVKEGETVPVNSVVATIGNANEVSAQGANGSPTRPEAASAQSRRSSPETVRAEADAQGAAKSEKADATGTPGATVAAPAAPDTKPATANREVLSPAELRQKSSPLVRKIAKEHNVDISQIAGSGIGGRVTKTDILGFIDNGGATKARSFDSQSTRQAREPLAQDKPAPI